MFRIPTYLAESRIHGFGVFAAGHVAAGTRIWEFTPGVDWRLTPEDLAAFPEPYQSDLRSWCYLDDDGMYILCGDNAKFMNHAEEPNCDDPEGRYTVTRRDIQAGEELTCDYRTFDRESSLNGVGFDRYAGAEPAASSNISS